MRRLPLVVVTIVLAGLLLFACAPAATPQAAAPTVPEVSSAPAPAAPKAVAQEPWKEEWDRTLNAAQREGSLSVYAGASGPTVRAGIVGAMKSRFGISVEWLAGKGGEMAEKILSERRVGLYLTDVYLGGSTTMTTQLKPAGAFDPLEPLLFLPEVLDTNVWFGGQGIRWLDKGHYVAPVLTYASASLLINTELVKPGEIKGYADLLNPKWKGKVVINDPTMAGTGGKKMGVIGAYLMNWDFVRELAKQEPIILRDQRLMVEWVARGKYPVLIAPEPEIANEFMRAGTPIAFVFPIEGDYVSSGTSDMGVLNRRPHPNATKLFANWLLSKEGSTVLSKAIGAPATRMDVTREGLDPNMIPKPGIKYIWSDTEEFGNGQPEHFRMSKEIFGPLIK